MDWLAPSRYGSIARILARILALFLVYLVWEEGKDAYYNPFPPTASIMPNITLIRSYYKVALMHPTDSPDFLQFCYWKNVFYLEDSSLKWKQ